ncbi:Tat pathway signal protein [Phenylobacterium sp. Root77]|uniref:DUF885 domain-containing protein n=1 Tax=unclassified Phenylobacterium TaxID=2640670 RepID=UPI00070120A3|nr:MULTISPECIES: DUF885 family protein [unclassified Phenylobacterium]KQW70672.1 Tat pathway signal protein [Phenylobacterium sp. Root1277]KQW90909.1 Tat pathway signal protein [Phenylobacterium sp. Root1290]KRC39460.1 Tat pathway signal protein [Phenylobacterium sp. Root77]
MHNRRQLLASAAAFGAAAAAPKLALAAAPTGEAAKMYAFFDKAMAQTFRRSPELPTALGIDKGDLAWTKSELSDFSLTALAENKANTTRDLKDLHSLDRKQLKGMDAVNYDTVEFVLSVQDEANRRFQYGGQGVNSPYVISQLTGAYQQMPDFLDTQHRIEAKDDADAYVARMEAFGRLLDQEADVVRHDVALGVTPPDFVLDKAITQLKAFLAYEPEKAPLVASLVRRTKEKNIEGDWAGQAQGLYGEKVRPALARQLALLEGLRPKAVHDAGCWRLPDGDEYYRLGLRNYTTSNITPDEVHQTGLDLVASLGAEADALMKKAGYTKGSVGERYRAMAQDPKQVYPNTDAGKEELLAKLNEQVKVIQGKLPQWFGQLPKAPLEIRRVPPATEAGAPGGYYFSPSLDGTRPGIYWINLRDTAEVPAWTLPTLTYHEGLPGHHLQLALNNEAGDLPLIRKVIGFSGYSEGWALYAEQLAVEMGMYDNDVLGHIGMIHDAMFRAVRLVVDSGMHHKRWSREQAVKYFVDNIGDAEASAITEVERYCVWPGQACSYMVGKITWMDARARAKKALGRKFDIRKFHDAGLLSGGTPLTVLDQVIDNYIASAK